MPTRKSKSLFRQPGVRKFQLVHRSQRDPLIHDPDASTHVLKAIGGSSAKGKEKVTHDDGNADDDDDEAGQAAHYGIYYDDSEYDYMQHLRPVGVREEGVESIWIDAPVPQASAKAKGKAKVQTFLRKDKEDEMTADLPPEVLPSKYEMTMAQAQDARGAAVPEALRGLQPDMDPHLRQALEALEDEAFVVAEVAGLPLDFHGKVQKGVQSAKKEETEKDEQDEGEEVLDDADDFFAELVADGERDEDEEAPWDFRDEGFDDDAMADEYNEETTGEGGVEDDSNWEARFKRFKLSQKQQQTVEDGASEDELDEDAEGRSEARDTVGTLPKLPVIGGKRRHKGTSDASGYSMSSSSMFRNEGLSALDERFDQVEKEYLSDSDDTIPDDSDDDSAPELITSRDDFNAIMDDFLDNFEVFGGKMHSVLPGDTPAGKLGTLRDGLRDEHGFPIKIDDGNSEEEDESGFDLEDYIGVKKDGGDEKWDCETILSTYSNLSNHPKLIRASRSKSVAKIILDPKTGLPTTLLPSDRKKSSSRRQKPLGTIDEHAEASQEPPRVTTARSKDESKEDKKARKQAVKEERQARRTSKKETRAEFENEKRHQIRVLANAPARGVRKL